MTKIKVEVLDRRQFMLAASATTAALMAGISSANATAEMAAEYIKKLTGGASMMEGKVKIDLPEIAENGNTVPVKVSVDSPMTADNYVKTLHLVSEGNPGPEMASFHFTPASGRANAAARMRLAKTQNVVGIAEMSDGKIYTAKTLVKVTIGGCGG